MIPALRAPSLFGRTGVPRVEALHAAFPDMVGVGLEGVPLVGLSENGTDFTTLAMSGGVSQFVTAGPGLPGAFKPLCSLRLGNKLYLGGRILDGGNPARAGLFVADVANPRVFTQVITGIEGAKGTEPYRGLVGIAANQDYLVVLSSTGEIAVSDLTGGTWTAQGKIGFGGSNPIGIATCLGASAAGFVAGGITGQLRTASDPRGTWTARTSQFGTVDVKDIAVGPVFVIVGNGRISTAALTNLATWTARTEPSGSALDKVFVSGNIFFAGASVWIRSDGGTSWTQPAARPWGSESTRVRSAYKAGSRWYVHYGNGNLAVSDNDGSSWSQIAAPGLEPVSHPGAAFLGPGF